MSNQLNIDFTHRQENNADSQMILMANKRKINGKTMRTLHLLAYGHVLTVYDALVTHGISSLPRRIKDIEEFIGQDLKAERTYDIPGPDGAVIKDRYAHYYFNEAQKLKAISILKGLK
jgi:hypothetical protein